MHEACDAPIVYLVARPDAGVVAHLASTRPAAILERPARESDMLAAVRLAWHRSRRDDDGRPARRERAGAAEAGRPGVAHDFKNLLTIISSDVEILLDEPLSPVQRSLVEEMGHAVDRAVSLARQMLTFSRRDRDVPVVSDFNELIGTALALLHRLLPEHITLVESLCDTPLPVAVDVARFERIVLNLGTNARDAMPSGGTLRVSTRLVQVAAHETDESAAPRPGAYAALVVQDSGVGMDEETRRRVFEPFFTTKGLDGGLGLGLATMDEIVRAGGGRVVVESAPGRGSTFTVYLPIADDEAGAGGTAFGGAADPGT